MSEPITVARPHVKTAFNFAVEHSSVEHWQDMLAFAAEVTRDDQVAGLLSGALAPETLSEASIAIRGEQLDENGQNPIKVVVENNRLRMLPDVLEQFIHLRAAGEAIARVEVISAGQLSDERPTRTANAMEKRLLHKVELNCRIDESAMAGIAIHVGDMVIDDGTRGRLDCLADVLQS